MELLLAPPAIVAVSVYKYWTPMWKKATKKASMNDLLQLAKMTLVWGLVLNNEVCNTLVGFKDKFSKEKDKLKKLSEDLKEISTEKVQLKSDNRALQFKLAMLVAAEADLKANNLEAVVAEKDKQLAKAREEVEKVRIEHDEAEVRTVLAYKEEFPNTPEYLQLAHLFMMAGGDQLVEKIGETHPEWVISFLRYASDGFPA
ncbi:hypothetical protein Adt_12284 [Abeliophyllum distichum]|uniref:Uncharacterized protein n=1 Tax=Abeliophyllum distichum TaxID=126358 RepID=A0ABD1UQC7_9LAMI